MYVNSRAINNNLTHIWLHAFYLCLFVCALARAHVDRRSMNKRLRIRAHLFTQLTHIQPQNRYLYCHIIKRQVLLIVYSIECSLF